MSNTYFISITELQQRLRARTLSPVDVVEAALQRIGAHNPKLNAFIAVLGDQAREQAQAAERDIEAGHWRGPLHGVPIGIKDFYDTAGVRTTAAFEAFKNRVPARDAIAVRRLKDAGAIVIGKMNMHQLGMGTTGLEGCFGPARNPWNDAYIPGGSSSGSAAAVAAGLCYATLDTDAIGSCRLPAACCGVVGFKGTYGVISTEGILEGEQPPDDVIEWLAHAGITTRTVDDTAIVLEALAEPGAKTKMSDGRSKPLRIGVADNFSADDGVRHAFEAAVDTMRALRHHTVVRAAAPFDMPRFGDLRTIEADRKTIAGRAFKDIDVLVLPTMMTTVLRVEDARANPQVLSPANTMFANYFGLPALSVPCALDDNGLPIGLQIVGKPWDDRTVVRIAREYLTAAPWTHHPRDFS
jgi:aspartyl-tRNA(Asn)/glutamyl-tRNA(Gln) amidotransferase subunit A